MSTVRSILERAELSEGVYQKTPADQAITNSDHTPRKVAERFLKDTKAFKDVKVTVEEGRAVLPGDRRWDYAVYIMFRFEPKGEDPFKGALTVNFGDDEVSGSMHFDAPRGVVASRAGNFDGFMRRLVGDLPQKTFGVSEEIEESESTPMLCNECGKKFKKKLGRNTYEVKCPKCGGYDTEPTDV